DRRELPGLHRHHLNPPLAPPFVNMTYGAGVAGLLFATPGLIEHGCFSSKSAQISFLIIVFSIVLGVFFSLRVAARAHIDLYRAFERRGEASMSGSTEKAAGCGQFSYIVGSCVPAASAPVMHALSVVFWVSISFGFGVAVFVFSSDCFSAPSLQTMNPPTPTS
ncbi:MAG: hypothetical protein ACK4L4_13805, partial [Gemmobacter sp.]